MKIPTNDFQVRNEEVEAKLKHIGDLLRQRMAPGYGFVLLIASLNDEHGSNVFYTSNCNREDVIGIMRDFIAKREPN